VRDNLIAVNRFPYLLNLYNVIKDHKPMSPLLDRKYLLLWVKVFLGMTLFWGILMGLWVSKWVGAGYGKGLPLGILFGAAFGTFMITILGAMDYYYKRRLWGKYGRVDHCVRQKRELIVPDTYERVFQQSEEVLSILGVEISEAGNGMIKGTLGPTLRSFGETRV
jgi:hypothetical protein